MNYLKRLALSVDLGLNTLRGGLPGETISAWVFRKDYKVAIKAINFIFRNPDHCKEAYAAVKESDYVPDEYKDAEPPAV